MVVVVSARLEPVTSASWLWFGMLAVGSVVHLEAARGIERVREIAAEGSPYAHMQSTWFFAGILLLPPPLLAALIAVSFAHEWYVVYRGRAIAFRKVFSASTVVLGCAAAAAVFSAFSFGHPPETAVLNSPRGLLGLVGAGFLYWLVNYALVVGAIAATSPDKPARAALGNPSDQLIIAGSMGLGSAVAFVVVHVPWSAPVLLVTVLAVHLGLLLPQLRVASQTDSKTGLVDPTWWETIAARELDRARRLHSTVAVLMLDLDHFKHVNDRYGHLAGDRVLREISTAIRQSVRGYDLVGRWGGEEFAVLMPGLSAEDTEAAAERIRAHIASLSVTTRDRTNTEVHITGLTVSIGAGRYPEHATELSPLLLITDDALLRAKEQGRNRIVTANPALPLQRQQSALPSSQPLPGQPPV
ncbi:GGDEF domain-containing protein [Actinophytocola sp. S1-96]|uniref:GGDEF domain-containing protein n=1 Tax=Actinophytocola gossypii TaxID=2812003 RepID=A0ABT2JAC0_9PSEU|nr:GGDEF domain-containing protein [Actinophytocola gossypii]